MATDKKYLQAVSTAMDLAPRRASGELDAPRVENLQRAEEQLLALPARQLLDAFLEWNSSGRPVFALNPPPSRMIPNSSPKDERTVRGRFSRSGIK